MFYFSAFHWQNMTKSRATLSLTFFLTLLTHLKPKQNKFRNLYYEMCIAYCIKIRLFCEFPFSLLHPLHMTIRIYIKKITLTLRLTL